MIDDMEASLEGAIPPEVSKMIKTLLKEGKSFKEAAKMAWAEYKKSNDTKKASLEEEHKIVLEAKDKEIEVLKQELATQKQEIIIAEEEVKPESKVVLTSGVADSDADKEDKKSSMQSVSDYYFRQRLDKK
jgi:predicted nucleotidyltransferase